MSSELTVFREQELLGKSFKIYGDMENPMFLAKEVATWINHSNVSSMLKKIDEEEKGINIVYTLGGSQNLWFLTEDGLYEVLMQSRKPIAKEFKKKVKEILKDIRKHGAYMTESTIEEALTNPDFLIQLATNLKEEQNKRKEAERQLTLKQEEVKQKEEIIVEQKPKVEYVEKFVESKGLQGIKEVGNTFGYGRNTFAILLREKDILTDNNKPYQRYLNLGWFEVKSFIRNNFSGTVTLFTPKGIYGVAKKLELLSSEELKTLKEHS